MTVVTRFTSAFWLVFQAFDADAQSRAADRTAPVSIEVVATDDSQAMVTERFRLVSDAAGLQLQLLQRPCAIVGPVVAFASSLRAPLAGSAGVTLAARADGPWTLLSDSAIVDASGLELRYTVTGRGRSVDIPLVHPREAVPRGDDDREGGVVLRVATPGEPTFPRLVREGVGGTWTGRFVAVPSFVRVEWEPAVRAPAGPCPEVAIDASDGGLTWRLWTLVGIMAVWVPLYLAWARRGSDGSNE
ncbi:MAG: hypothetical protein MNPFHGCM_00032 [Gemmatimonadaceae bacterium]|nr:hypothetical protein [Gemmatimonadaceae bacterium]